MKVDFYLIIILLYFKGNVFTPSVLCNPDDQQPKNDEFESNINIDENTGNIVDGEPKEKEREYPKYKTIDPKKLKNVEFDTFRRVSRKGLIDLNFEDISLKNYIVRKSVDGPLSYKITPAPGTKVRTVKVSKGPMWISSENSEFKEAFIYQFLPSVHYFIIKIIDEIDSKYIVSARYQSVYKISSVFDFTCSVNTPIDEERVVKETLDLSSSFDKKYFDHKFACDKDIRYDQYQKESCFIDKVYDGSLKIWESMDKNVEKDISESSDNADNIDGLANIVRVYSKGDVKRAIVVVLNSDEAEYLGFDQNTDKWEPITKEEFSNIVETEMNEVIGKNLSIIEAEDGKKQVTKIDISQNKYRVLYTNSIGEFRGLKLDEIKIVESILDGKEIICEKYLEKCNIELIEYKKSTQFLEIQSKGRDNLYYIKTTKDEDKNWQRISQTRFRQIFKKYLENDSSEDVKYITIEGKQEREMIKDEKDLPKFDKGKDESSFMEIKPIFGILAILILVMFK